MQKPIYLLPFIFVYKIVSTIIKIPFLIIRYFTIGGFYIISKILRLVEINIKGFIWICYFVYTCFRYFLKGILVVLSLPLLIFKVNKKEKVKVVEENTLEIENVVNEIEQEQLENQTIEEQPEIYISEPIVEDKIQVSEIVEDIKQDVVAEPLKEEQVQEIITEKQLKKLEKQKIKIQKRIINEQAKKQKLAQN